MELEGWKMKMSIEVLARGITVRTFELPDLNELVDGISDDKAIELGRNIVKEISAIVPKLIKHQQQALDTCNCFWRKKSPEEREVFHSHSSECAIWSLPNEEI